MQEPGISSRPAISSRSGTRERRMDMRLRSRGVVVVSVATLAVATAAGCGSSGSSSEGSGGSTPAAAVPNVDAGAFTADFSVMKQFKGLAAQGKGKVGVLAAGHDDVGAVCDVRRAVSDAGVQDGRAHGLQDRQRPGQREHDAAAGRGGHHRGRVRASRSTRSIRARGAAIEANAESKGVKVIDYDRLVTGRPVRPVLRQLQQRRGRQADRPGHGRLPLRVERQEARTSS